MDRKSLKETDLEPSYQDIVDQLIATIGNYTFENAALKVKLRKMEDYIKQFENKDSSQ